MLAENTSAEFVMRRKKFLARIYTEMTSIRALIYVSCWISCVWIKTTWAEPLISGEDFQLPAIPSTANQELKCAYCTYIRVERK